MTNAELISKIKTEIERLKKEELTRNSIGVITGSAFFVSANELLSFLDTLQESSTKTSPFTGGKVILESREEEITFRGEKIKIDRKFYRCKDTDEKFTDAELDNDMMWNVFRKYCEKKGVESFDELLPRDNQQEPEVDLEKEIRSERKKLLDIFGPMNGEQSLTVEKFARYFYDLGKNAK